MSIHHFAIVGNQWPRNYPNVKFGMSCFVNGFMFATLVPQLLMIKFDENSLSTTLNITNSMFCNEWKTS